MAQLAGIRQSVSRAWQLLCETGFLDMSRGLNTEAWEHNVSEAVRELREAAQSLVAEGNRDAYGEMDQGLRLTLWKSILRARAPATGEYIISRLGGQYRDMTDDVRAAERALAGQANGFPTRQLHQMTSIILNASPDQATAIEQEAARQGDPMPRGITTQEAELYQRIVLRAMQHSDREVSSYRNAGDAAISAFGESFIPAHTIDGRLMDRVEESGLEAMFGEAGGEQAGAIIGVLRALYAGADAHQRMENAQYRLTYWIRQGCLAESRNDSQAAAALERRLLDIKRRMDEWLAWLQRHQDHPSYVPPDGRWEAAPRASAEDVRSGAASRNGSVMGSVRGPSSRGPAGLA